MKISQGYICPVDQTCVACVGEHTDTHLVGKCTYCKRTHRISNQHPDRPSRDQERIMQLEAEIERLKAEPEPIAEEVVEPEHHEPEPEQHEDGSA